MPYKYWCALCKREANSIRAALFCCHKKKVISKFVPPVKKAKKKG